MVDIGHLFEPIPLADFKEHVKNLHRNDDYPFSDEYSVSKTSRYTDGILNYAVYRTLNQAMLPPLKLPTILTMPPKTDMQIYQLVRTWSQRSL
jgi:hypothetical protein